MMIFRWCGFKEMYVIFNNIMLNRYDRSLHSHTHIHRYSRANGLSTGNNFFGVSISYLGETVESPYTPTSLPP